MRDRENIDLYAVLQVHPTAEPEIVDAAYRRLARMYHPDVNKAHGAHETMIRINLAYEILGDPAKRAAYDRDPANRQQTEWQAWTERAERERRERAEREQRQRQAQADREQRERSEQAERERRARANAERQRAEQERAEREHKERQAQPEPTHQSYAEWEADMQRQVRANAERQRAESERQARVNQEASTKSQQHERSDAEQRLPIRSAIIGGAFLAAILTFINSGTWILWFRDDYLQSSHSTHVIVRVMLEFDYVPVILVIVVGAFNLSFSFITLITSVLGPFGVPSGMFWDPHPQWRVCFVRAAITTAFALLPVLGILVGLLGNDFVIFVVSSFVHHATGGIASGLYSRDFPQWYKEEVANGNWWRK